MSARTEDLARAREEPREGLFQTASRTSPTGSTTRARSARRKRDLARVKTHPPRELRSAARSAGDEGRRSPQADEVRPRAKAKKARRPAEGEREEADGEGREGEPRRRPPAKPRPRRSPQSAASARAPAATSRARLPPQAGRQGRQATRWTRPSWSRSSARTRDPVYRSTSAAATRYKAHDETNQYKVGDRVEIQEHRPISRDKRCIVRAPRRRRSWRSRRHDPDANHPGRRRQLRRQACAVHQGARRLAPSLRRASATSSSSRSRKRSPARR